MHRYTRPSAIHLLLYVRPILDILVELADVAVYRVPRLEGEGYNRYETECKPLPIVRSQRTAVVKEIVRGKIRTIS
jgi:hypothetical protein